MTVGDVEQARYSGDDPKRPSYGNANVSWPTPTASDSGRGSGTFKRGNPTLTGAVRAYPTPTVMGNHNRKGLSEKSADGLATVVKELERSRWSTPTATDWKNRESSCRDSVLQKEVGGQLNPRWVEWLMGFPVGWSNLKD